MATRCIQQVIIQPKSEVRGSLPLINPEPEHICIYVWYLILFSERILGIGKQLTYFDSPISNFTLAVEGIRTGGTRLSNFESSEAEY